MRQDFLANGKSKENRPKSAFKRRTPHQFTDEWLNDCIYDDENNVEGKSDYVSDSYSIVVALIIMAKIVYHTTQLQEKGKMGNKIIKILIKFSDGSDSQIKMLQPIDSPKPMPRGHTIPYNGEL